jgi:hypothetical protein
MSVSQFTQEPIEVFFDMSEELIEVAYRPRSLENSSLVFQRI